MILHNNLLYSSEKYLCEAELWMLMVRVNFKTEIALLIKADLGRLQYILNIY